MPSGWWIKFATTSLRATGTLEILGRVQDDAAKNAAAERNALCRGNEGIQRVS